MPVMAAYSPANASVSFNNHIICSFAYDQQLDNAQLRAVSNFQCIRFNGTLRREVLNAEWFCPLWVKCAIQTFGLRRLLYP